MRYLGRSFPNQTPDESKDLPFDFSDYAHRNDCISSATWAIAVDTGSDASVASRLIGDETHDSYISSHRVGTLQDGVRYKLTVTATMLSGEVLVLYSYVTGRA